MLVLSLDLAMKHITNIFHFMVVICYETCGLVHVPLVFWCGICMPEKYYNIFLLVDFYFPTNLVVQVILSLECLSSYGSPGYK